MSKHASPRTAPLTRTCIAMLTILLYGAAWGQPLRVQRLAAELHSSDIGVRRQAAISLGRVGFARSVFHLRRALGTEPEVAIRLEIIRALRNIVFLRYPGYPEALQALGDACDDQQQPDELVRLRASQALWEAAKKDLLDPAPMLERNLGDVSQRIRLSAVRMLRKYGAPSTLDPLGRAAIDKAQSESIRLQAIQALGAISLSDPGPVGRAVADANIRSTDAIQIPQLVDAASLRQLHRRQISYLATIVADSTNSATLMLAALKSMGQVKDKSAIAALRRVIQEHPDAAIRRHGTRVLSHVLARQYE